MCGIAGIFYFNSKDKEPIQQHKTVLEALKHRGPDFQRHLAYPSADLYHSRLSILDLSEASHQPFEDGEKHHALVYNGEIFNYKSLPDPQVPLNTSGDVEVLFELLKKEKLNALSRLNGFFSIGFLDALKQELLLARDRYGVKPLYYYKDDKKLVFASELKALLCLTGPLELNIEQLYTYLRLNYCAGPERIFKGVYSLPPGTFLKANRDGITCGSWHDVTDHASNSNLETLLTDAVKLRLEADVPAGCFLSGGLDSSLISALAKKEKPGLKTFSIGFKEHMYLDESRYAEMVAQHIKSTHYSYNLNEDDFLHQLPEFLKGIDEPFADSSAFNFYLLSKYSRNEVKVALSGDGADELFKGYLKHKALLYSAHPLVRSASGFINLFSGRLPGSRESAFQNSIRKLKKLGQLRWLNPLEKQELLASISSHEECKTLIKTRVSGTAFNQLFRTPGNFKEYPLEDWFDLQVVLAEDMLVKTDRFSMRHGLEIRNPFLDYRIVDYALHLERNQKISLGQQKIILRKQLAHLVPEEIVKRPKKGFELPLKSWLCGQLKTTLEKDWLNESKIKQEGLLNVEAVAALKSRLFSSNPGDSAAKVWALIVLENWMDNYKPFIKSHA